MRLVRAPEPELRPVFINDLALNTTLFYAEDLSYTALDIGLSSALFGVLTLLVAVALVFLIRKGFGHTPARILLPSTLLLYGSTVLFMASLVGHVTSVNRLVARAQAGLFSDAYTIADLDAFQDDVLRHSWMMTVALGTNLLIGDSIVWWRVCAVWKNRVVYCVGPLLIVLVFAFGAKALCGEQRCLDPPQQPQTLLRADVFTNACAVLSLAVNALATLLIGYKAWAHRRLLRGRFGRGRGRQWHWQSRGVMDALALLVESGTIYCLLLIMVVVYQATPALFPTPAVHQSAVLSVVADYTYACFVPVIAIYPILIIVIVALNWSPIEHCGLASGAGDCTHGAADVDEFEGRYLSTVTGTATRLDLDGDGDGDGDGGGDGGGDGDGVTMSTVVRSDSDTVPMQMQMRGLQLQTRPRSTSGEDGVVDAETKPGAVAVAVP